MHKTAQRSSKAHLTNARGRGRPRGFDRETALAKATRLFWIKGYEATSIADLTEAMGVGSPSLYAAFGSKEALYVEALGYYRETYEVLVWGGFLAAETARAAVQCLLVDSAKVLSGSALDIPNGCMVTLSPVKSEGYEALGSIVLSARAITFDRLRDRLARAVAEGEFPASVDIHALSRFIQTLQSGMSILARDAVTPEELESVAQLAMSAWDARTASQSYSLGP